MLPSFTTQMFSENAFQSCFELLKEAETSICPHTHQQHSTFTL